ncbi:MAG: hypothetical protein GF398_17655 [Chitinivibrionales bacterium]|nr:hypothetical protein [Chitinivibrionales bacterium]
MHDFEQLISDNRQAEMDNYGSLSKLLHQRVEQASNDYNLIPVSLSLMIDDIEYSPPPIITSNNIPPDIDAWRNSHLAAIDSRNTKIIQRANKMVDSINTAVSRGWAPAGFDPQVSIDPYSGTINAVLTAKILENHKILDSVSLIVPIDSVLPVQDMWWASYRMNIDNFHTHNYQGSGITAANWEGGYPNFENQMSIDDARFNNPDHFGYCADPSISTEAACLAITGGTWNSTESRCVILTGGTINKAGCEAGGYTWNLTPDQHVAYMLSAIKNARTNTINASAPTTYGGTGFAPGAELILANFRYTFDQFAVPSFYVSEMFDGLQWAINLNATAINQSWHTAPITTETVGGVTYSFDSEISGDDTYDDKRIDLIASIFPFPTICQSAGSIDKPDEYVNHKGYNTIVVGQDLRDGYQIASISAYKNPANKQELPHVTAGFEVPVSGWI